MKKVMFAVVLLALVAVGAGAHKHSTSFNIVPAAHADEVGGCTLASLRGSYAVRMEGEAFGEAFHAVGVQNLDGNGNWVGSEIAASEGGVSPNMPFNGTYSVNADCSGTMTANFPGGFTGHLSFWTADNRKTLVAIETDPGSVLSGTFIRQ